MAPEMRGSLASIAGAAVVIHTASCLFAVPAEPPVVATTKCPGPAREDNKSTCAEQPVLPKPLLTKDGANSLAEAFLFREGPDLAFRDDETLEEDFGWLFFPTHRKCLRTPERCLTIDDLWPLAVDVDGHIEALPGFATVAEKISAHEYKWEARQAGVGPDDDLLEATSSVVCDSHFRFIGIRDQPRLFWHSAVRHRTTTANVRLLSR